MYPIMATPQKRGVAMPPDIVGNGKTHEPQRAVPPNINITATSRGNRERISLRGSLPKPPRNRPAIYFDRVPWRERSDSHDVSVYTNSSTGKTWWPGKATTRWVEGNYFAGAFGAVFGDAFAGAEDLPEGFLSAGVIFPPAARDFFSNFRNVAMSTQLTL